MWRVIAIAILLLETSQAMGQSSKEGTSSTRAKEYPTFPQLPSEQRPPSEQLDSVPKTSSKQAPKKDNPLQQSPKMFDAKPLPEVNVTDPLELLKISRYNAVISEIAILRSHLELQHEGVGIPLQLLQNSVDRYSETALPLAKTAQEKRNILESCLEFLSWVESIELARSQVSDVPVYAVYDTKYRRIGYEIQLLKFDRENNSSASSEAIQKPQSLNLRQLDHYVKINARPIELKKTKSSESTDDSSGPHVSNSSDREFSNVYINGKAQEIIMHGKGNYPVGSVVINAVSKNPSGTAPTRFEVMEKMPTGYDPLRGDWKYSIVDGTSFSTLASGRIDSCINCHSRYANTDFVARTYLDQPK